MHSLFLFAVVAFIGIGNAVAAPNTLSTLQLAARTLPSSSSELPQICAAYESSSQKIEEIHTYLQSPSCSKEVTLTRFVAVSQTTYETVTQYSNCKSCNAVDTTDPTALRFHKSFASLFLEFQLIIQVLKAKWGDYKQYFAPCFHQFDSTFQHLIKFGASLQVDVKAILLSIGVKLDLFLNVGVQLGGLLNLNLGLGLGLGLGIGPGIHIRSPLLDSGNDI